MTVAPNRRTAKSPASRPITMAAENAANPEGAASAGKPRDLNQEHARPVADAALGHEGEQAEHADAQQRPRRPGDPPPGPFGGQRPAPGRAARARRWPPRSAPNWPAARPRTPNPSQLDAATTPAPTRPPRLNAAWNDDMIACPRPRSTSAARAFMQTSSDPVAAPNTSSDAASMRQAAGKARPRQRQRAGTGRSRSAAAARRRAPSQPAERHRQHRAERHRQQRAARVRPTKSTGAP